MNITAQFAAQSYGAAKPATQAEAGSAAGAALKDFVEVMQQGEQAAQKAVTGGVDPHTLVQALAQTELAVQTAVTVRDKVVEAYQEILRMPV